LIRLKAIISEAEDRIIRKVQGSRLVNQEGDFEELCRKISEEEEIVDEIFLFKEKGSIVFPLRKPLFLLSEEIQELKEDGTKIEANFNAAAELHEKMLALRPGAASSYVNLALAQARQKNFEAAIATLKRGIEKIPDSEILLSRLGYTYLVTGRRQEALATMAEVLKINPRSMDALTATAVILDDMGKKEEALTSFEQALAIEPENKFLRMSYGQNLAASGRVAEALDIYTRLTQDYPKDPMPYQLLGITYAMLKDFDKAIENLKQATYIKPMPPAYYYLALSYREKGDIREAARYLELYLEDPKDEPETRIKNAETGLKYLKTLLK